MWLLEEFSLLFHLCVFVAAAYYSRTPLNTYTVADFLQGIYLKEQSSYIVKLKAHRGTLENRTGSQQKSGQFKVSNCSDWLM